MSLYYAILNRISRKLVASGDPVGLPPELKGTLTVLKDTIRVAVRIEIYYQALVNPC